MTPKILSTNPLPLTARLQRFSNTKVLCLGDVIIDRFVEGTVERISPESPVPIFNSTQQKLFPGGAANVARNIFSLGGQCTLVGVVGDDSGARELTQEIEVMCGRSPVFITCSDRPTTEKTRFVANGHHMLRVDVEVSDPVSGLTADRIIAQIDQLIADHDVLVLSDYAKGVLTDAVANQTITLARAAGKPIIVDPKSHNFAKYSGATLITPNSKEMHAVCGINPVEDRDAVTAGRRGLDGTKIDAILITRSEKGMTLVPNDAEAIHIPSSSREVFDVVGAGDTVVATIAVAIGAGASIESASRMANAAAGIVVGKRGTATVSPDELMFALENLENGQVYRGAPIMLTPNDVVRYAQARKAEGKRVGFTNGVFDILHPGHISILQFSRDACDALIVGLNSDDSVKLLKGSTRPINNQNDRAAVLGALGTVDAVVIFDTDTPNDLIKAIEPDVLIKGADYAIDTVVGADSVAAYGGKVLLAPLVPGVSSTKTIEKAGLGETK